MKKREIREFLKCDACPIKLDVSPEAFPDGMFPKQEAIAPFGTRVIFLGRDEEGNLWYVYFNEDGLHYWDLGSQPLSKQSYIREGFKFLN